MASKPSLPRPVATHRTLTARANGGPRTFINVLRAKLTITVHCSSNSSKEIGPREIRRNPAKSLGKPGKPRRAGRSQRRQRAGELAARRDPAALAAPVAATQHRYSGAGTGQAVGTHRPPGTTWRNGKKSLCSYLALPALPGGPSYPCTSPGPASQALPPGPAGPLDSALTCRHLLNAQFVFFVSQLNVLLVPGTYLHLDCLMAPELHRPPFSQRKRPFSSQHCNALGHSSLDLFVQQTAV
jgi:hypothetical protein